jgi:hypothetical protein
MKPTDNIRKILSEKFENFEAEPQDNSWENIRFALDLKEKLSSYEAEPQDDSWEKIMLVTQLSDKFKDFEAEPQDDSWEKIKLVTQLSDKFKDFEAEPQAESWQKIKASTRLDEKFKHYGAEPQEATWAKIQLATHLTNKFKNYEAEPKAESWQKIKAAITPEKERRIILWPFAYRVGIAASIALLLGFGWLIYNNSKIASSGIALNKHSNATASGKVSSKDFAQNNASDNSKSTDAHSEKNTVPNGVLTEQIASSKKKNNGLISNNKIALNEKNTQKSNFFSKKTPKKKHLNNGFANHLNKESLANNDKPIDSGINDNSTIFVSSNQSEIAETKATLNLELIDSKAFKTKNIRLPFGAIAYNNERPMEEKEEKVRRKMILTSSIMPLQTYQALTILPQTTTYIQQVGTLNAIDAQRLGIQARVGVMQSLSNRFSTGISLAYSGIQQSINYEVNNGTYDVLLDATQSYTVVGVGEAINQNKFLHTVGLKIDNAYLVSNQKNKLFVLGGAEAVRVLNNNQYAYYLNASVAISYPTKSGKTVWIEPTYRYSLSQSLDANNYLQIRPSNIGLNVRMNFM